MLQAKINAYISFLEEKQYKDIYQDMSIMYGIIEIHFLHCLTKNAEKFPNRPSSAFYVTVHTVTILPLMLILLFSNYDFRTVTLYFFALNLLKCLHVKVILLILFQIRGPVGHFAGFV